MQRSRQRYFLLGLLVPVGAVLIAWSRHGDEPRGAPTPPSAEGPGVPFIANQGQTDERVRFYAGIRGGTAYVTRSGEIVYDLPQAGATGWALKEELVGGAARVEGELKATTSVSHLVGSDRSAWRAKVPTYDVVTLGEVYQGIELKLRAAGATVEKLFQVKPGARPEAIGVRLSGATFVRANDRGELEVGTGLGTV